MERLQFKIPHASALLLIDTLPPKGQQILEEVLSYPFNIRLSNPVQLLALNSLEMVSGLNTLWH